MTITIREAIAGDEAVLARLNGVVHSLHVIARPDYFGHTSTPDLVEWFREILQRPTQRTWLAEVDGNAAGYLLAVLHERPANLFCLAQRWCEIDQLAVLATMRRQGVAMQLVDAAIGWARSLGIERVSAQCWSFNTEAQSTFARLGFTPMTLRLERPSSD